MLLSRFWYVLLGLLLGALVFALYLAESMYNRQGMKAMAEGLSADSQVVSWYLKNDARERSAHLITFTLEGSIPKGLAEASATDGKVPDKVRDAVLQGLTKVAATIPKDQGFDAVFAVDQRGRVVAHLGYEQATGMDDFELGGYPVVADALHGFVRDDTLVLDRVYRVVARPVEYDLGQMPAGAIIGARIIDDRFARELSTRTGAAVAFYAGGARIASGAPEGFDRGQLDMIVNDIKDAEDDPDYKAKGRSTQRLINPSLGVVYSRLPGEAWNLGSGYVVGRNVASLTTPLGFFAADDKDKSGAKIPVVLGIALLAMGLGLLFSYLEYTRPLSAFRDEAELFAKGKADQLQPSKFRGIYRTIASHVNDGIDAAAGKAGGTRRAADLTQVLGDLPAEPTMSAFSFPGDSPASPKPKPAAPKSAPGVPLPLPLPLPLPVPASNPRAPLPSAPRAAQASSDDGVVSSVGIGEPSQKRLLVTPQRPPSPVAAPVAPVPAGVPVPAVAAVVADTQTEEWRAVYDEFAATKQKCGESVDGFSFEKFQNTLKKNRDAIVERHGVKKVKFSVYVKDGKAALKASPVKD